MKHDHAIVYRGNDKTVILTREDFENEEEFEKWRLWMRENTSDKRMGRSVRLWEDMSLVADSEDAAALEDEEEKHLWCITRENLTRTQYRRLCVYVLEKMTLREIAEKEGSCYQVIHKSIIGAKKKLRGILERKKRKR